MNTLIKKLVKGRFQLKQNIDFVLRDKKGNVKPIWQPNALMLWLIRKGWMSPLAPKVPLLFGFWANNFRLSNLVVDAGKAGVASRINGAGGEAAFTFIAIGTGTTAAAAGDTALGNEITTGGGARAAATASRVTTDVTNDTAQLVLTFNFTASFAVTESGAFNAVSAGVLLARQVFSAINVVSGDSLQVTWKFDVD
jgi:hypothetical protein